ncbi:MAG: AAA family ATPase [Ferruginibacter sp.]|nr:AAA family ATPase [Ferruginibacter sp.]
MAANEINSLPYSDIFSDLLMQIHRALGYCYEKHKRREILTESDKQLQEFFSKFAVKYRQSGLNRHITKGLTKSEQKKQNVYPRISKIIIQAFQQVQESKKNVNYKAEVLPSPFQILYHILTVPSEPQTSAYPFILCRSVFFYFLGVHPKNPELPKSNSELAIFTEEDILNSIRSFRNHIKIQLRWPDPRLNPERFSSRINFLTAHVLGVKGIAHLWFTSDKELLAFCSPSEKKESLAVLKELYSRPKYHFRLSNLYTELPNASEVINWIFGLPMPIRGADILFHGGLKKTSSSGLVISLHGQPGTGKTSAALSIAATLSPLKTTCIYLSLEEEEEDLTIRLQTLVPEYLKELSIYDNETKTKKEVTTSSKISWFTPFKINSNLNISELTDILKLLKSDLQQKQINDFISNKNSFLIPAVSPLFIVIDNINELFADKVFGNETYEKLEKFIQQCRDMGALVLLVAAEDIPNKIKLDYLVDVAIHLKQTGLDKQHEKTIRIFQLIKTRNQVSRQGSHIFHLSNPKGFRISPQVPSQLDKREKIRRLLPSEENVIPVLKNLSGKRKVEYKNFLSLASQSQILVHGFGSSGKAGFGLKLLLTPVLSKQELESSPGQTTGKLFAIKNIKKNKVLIVSFLYPEEYYDALVTKIKRQLHGIFTGYQDSLSICFVKAFYAGYLTPEDFVYKIVRLLDEANLEGEPYSGILLDGLHNVFLQFKNLQESHMIWPLLYSILARYNLTVVTTFTNFSLSERHITDRFSDSRNSSQSPDDFMLMQQGQKPFLHGLVKAADYYFVLEEIVDDKNNFERSYWLSVRSSIRQNPPTDILEWDRQDLVLKDIISEKNKVNF